MIKRIALVAAVLALAACSGGGGGNASPSAPVPPAAGAKLATPTFSFIISRAANAATVRRPDFVSSATKSVTITLTNPPAGLTPTSVTTPITTACTAANPCVVNGPASPPGVADDYLVQTFASSDGSGPVLDTGSVTITPVAGTANSTSVVLEGVPATLTIGNVPTTFAAGTAGQSQALSVTVADASGVTITGTYATPVLVSSPDTNGTQGTQITGPAPAGGCAASTTCAQLSASTDTATLTYGGLAENPVTLTASSPGITPATAIFTPVLAAIVHAAGPTSAAAGAPFGIDLYSTNPASTGYSGSETYSEAGYTNAPYNKSLSTTQPVGSPSCSTFANVTAANSVFTATSIASPAAGSCTLTVSDGLAHASFPTFVVTYTTSSVSGSATSRRN